MRIGYLKIKHTYADTRNIVGKVTDYEYKNITYFDLYYYRYVQSRLLRSPNDDGAKSSFLLRPPVDCVHLFNTVCFSHVPWVATFETMLPRYRSVKDFHRSPEHAPRRNGDLEAAFVRLASDDCLGIIAMSDSARSIQLALLEHFPEFQEIVGRKVAVMHPPQPVIANDGYGRRAERGNELRFCFVGHGFFRKGGREILSAFAQVRAETRANLKLTIISKLFTGDHATGTTPNDADAARVFMRQNADWIDFHETLPNSRVLALMQQSHVGLLPTWADTYGYSVLELQACGCPVITTDVRALAEINDAEAGWIIEVPKNSLGEAFYGTEEERAALSETIQCGLTECLREIVENPSILADKATAALDRIRRYHDPIDYASRLMAIYRGSAF